MSERQNFKIWVRDNHNNNRRISVNENDSIATLKQKSKSALGIGDDTNIVIIYNGQILTDEDKNEETSSPYKISDYEIKDGNFINIVSQQKLDFENDSNNNKMDNQIIKKTKKEKKDENEGDKQIINTENETKTNNEEDNENKYDEINSKQNLNASELDKKTNDETNLDSKNEEIHSQVKGNLNLNSYEDNKDKSNESNQSLDLNTGRLDSKNDAQKDSSGIYNDPQKQIDINNEKNESESEIIEKLSIEKTEKKITNANRPVNLNSNVGSDRKNIDNSSLIANSEDNNGSKKRKEDDLIDLKSISASQNKKNKDGEKNDSDTITLTLWTFGNGKEVTKLSVKKTTTMGEIKEQLKQKYNLSDERINELYLSYSSYNMFYDLDLTVEQVCNKEGSSEDIEKREVKACTRGFDFNLKTSENDRNKHGIKVNWKLIILIILGLLFFVCAGLAWYLEAAWFLIGGLAFAGLVFFGLSFIWLKLKSCIGCTKIDILKKQENKSPVKNSPGLGDIPRKSDNTLSQKNKIIS